MSTKAKSDWNKHNFLAWRARMGKTQDEAAEALGISARRIRDFEGGFAEIPLTIELACRHLETALQFRLLAREARRLADELDPPD